ncbi:hypothetical protein STEG23_030925, partial [Scotinomys teguina]
MEVVAAAPRCQLLLIMLMTAMLLLGMKVSPLLVWRKIASTIKLQENIGKGQFGEVCYLHNNTNQCISGYQDEIVTKLDKKGTVPRCESFSEEIRILID